MTALTDLHVDALEALEADLADAYARHRADPRRLDLTRGKPSADQLDLSAPMESALGGDYRAADGTDCRNYGLLRGIAEARALGAELLDVPAEQVICSGNSSLTLMHLTLDTALRFGLWGDQRRWAGPAAPRMLAPVPGYDRHFALAGSLGIELVSVPMTDAGPDMERWSGWPRRMRRSRASGACRATRTPPAAPIRRTWWLGWRRCRAGRPPTTSWWSGTTPTPCIT
jgi:DNA-binding transcriptional MocR family regulator